MLVIAAAALLSGAVLIRWGNDIALAFESDKPSRSIGSTRDGSLINGKRLPTSGNNFRPYGYLPVALGRNSLHGRVRRVVLSAFSALDKRCPGTTFLYGECSWPNGGRLRPHATHRNGLSIDFMVPVTTGTTTTVLKTSIMNKYGYSVHFDSKAWCEAQQCRIDFNAMAEHLHYLADAADAEGIKIWRIIFAPDLQPHLFATERGAGLRSRLMFSKKQSWVRHDEHYHVDFHNPDNDN
jgi:penicillin-insensitive murein endopeptidase